MQSIDHSSVFLTHRCCVFRVDQLRQLPARNSRRSGHSEVCSHVDRQETLPAAALCSCRHPVLRQVLHGQTALLQGDAPLDLWPEGRWFPVDITDNVTFLESLFELHCMNMFNQILSFWYEENDNNQHFHTKGHYTWVSWRLSPTASPFSMCKLTLQ